MTPEEWAVKFLARKPNGNPLDVLTGCFHQAIAEALSAGLPPAKLTAADLEAIRQRHAKSAEGEWVAEIFDDIEEVATLGRWSWYRPNTFTGQIGEVYRQLRPGGGNTGLPGSIEVSAEDATFIAHAHQDIPALLAHVEHLEGLFRDLSNDGIMEAYHRGYADGAKAGLESFLPLLDPTNR